MRIKRLYLNINKFWKTQHFPKKNKVEDLTEWTKPTFEDIEEDSKLEVEYENIRLEKNESYSKFKRGDRLKSLKN